MHQMNRKELLMNRKLRKNRLKLQKKLEKEDSKCQNYRNQMYQKGMVHFQKFSNEIIARILIKP